MQNFRAKLLIVSLIVQVFYSCLSYAAGAGLCSQLFDSQPVIATVSSDILKLQKDVLKSLSFADADAVKRGYLKFGVRLTENVSTETHTDIQIKVLKNGTIESIFTYDAQAVQQPATFLTEVIFYKMMTEVSLDNLPHFSIDNPKGLLKDFESRVDNFAMLELYRNAQQGELSSQIRLLRWKVDLIKNLNLEEGALKKSSDLAQQLKLVAQNLENQIKEKLDILEKKDLNQTSQSYDLPIAEVKELVKNNDRTGVVKLLRQKLPWEQFTVAEKNIWEVWISAIENPDPSQMVWAFRGSEKNEMVTVMKSANQENAAYFSPMLGRIENAKNFFVDIFTKSRSSGDVDRKNRSNIKEIDVQVANLTVNHGEGGAKNTMFLGFSMELEIAERFVGGNGRKPGDPGAMLVIRVDRRRLAANIASGFGKEFEVLAPLFVFPDEVMIYQTNYRGDASRAQLLERVKQFGGPAQEYMSDKEVQTFKSMGRALYHTLFGL